MNKKAQIFSYFFVGIMIIFALVLIGLMARATNPLYSQATANAGLTGLEAIAINNFNLIMFFTGSLALFLLFSLRGGE